MYSSSNILFIRCRLYASFRTFPEPPPFAPIFHDIQNGIKHLKVVVGDIASMDGETIRYTLVFPNFVPLSPATIRTLSKTTSSPAAPSRRSTRNLSPTWTRYCLPPVSKTAYTIIFLIPLAQGPPAQPQRVVRRLCPVHAHTKLNNSTHSQVIRQHKKNESCTGRHRPH